MQPQSVQRWMCIELNITTACQIDCVFCYKRSNLSGLWMSWETFKSCADAISRLFSGGFRLRWEFAGGEPTLHPGLLEMIRHLKTSMREDAARDHNRVFLITNGIECCDASFSNDLAESGLSGVRLSLFDWNEAVHDKITQISGSHAKTVQALRQLISMSGFDFSVGVHIVLSEANVDSFLDTLLFLFDEGVRNISVNRAVPPHPASHSEFESLPINAYLNAVKQGNELVVQRSDATLVNVHKILPCQLEKRLVWDMPSHMCGLGKSLLVVEPDGTVVGCDFFPVIVERLGDETPGGLRAFQHAFRQLRLHYRTSIGEKCQNCAWFESCGGPCPAEDDEVCEIITQYYKEESDGK